MDIEKISHTVRIERQRRGLTQAALADIAGVSRGRVEALENDRGMDMGMGTVRQILSALGYSLTMERSESAS